MEGLIKIEMICWFEGPRTRGEGQLSHVIDGVWHWEDLDLPPALPEIQTKPPVTKTTCLRFAYLHTFRFHRSPA